MSDPIVNTEQGKIKGIINKNHKNVQYYTFKGIPYAKAPIGDLRFSIPQPPVQWEGVRDGGKECNICAQVDKETNTVVGDEDCLFLNVYTPRLLEKSSSLLPVMVYFHGGGFVFGNGTDSTKHGPEYLVGKDVVLVSLNYRVGILGFLSLDLKDAPGNMGLRDQVQGLRWIQKNITSFGGNPDNVTIFGVSAGGASVEYLMLSPLAKGLFHRAIAQSGSSLNHWAHNHHVKELAAKIPASKGKSITDNEELLKYLKSLSTKELVASSLEAILAAKSKGGIYFGFVPTIEYPKDWEPFISKNTYLSLAKGEFTKVPFMTGFCTREGLLMVSHNKPVLDKFILEKKFVDYFPFQLNDTEKLELEPKLKDIYLQDEKTSSKDFAIDFFSDADFIGGIYTAAMLFAKHNTEPVYFYEFAYDGALNYLKKAYGINREGACHGDDGGYLLKHEVLNNAVLSDKDTYVQNVMLELWTNFAKYGDPNPKTKELLKTTWEPIRNIDDVKCLVIDENPHVIQKVYPTRVELYRELYNIKYGN